MKEERREALQLKITRFYSLDVSKSRKYKLIRDLYRNRDSRRLQKALPTETDVEKERN